MKNLERWELDNIITMFLYQNNAYDMCDADGEIETIGDLMEEAINQNELEEDEQGEDYDGL